MKRVGSIAVISVLALVGCENTSKLDNTHASAERNRPAGAAGDHSGSVEDRLARLENNYAKYSETFEWINGIYEQQAAQRGREPDPNAVFAVDVAPDVKIGAVEGPANALVTIVEAWDFA